MGSLNFNAILHNFFNLTPYTPITDYIVITIWLSSLKPNDSKHRNRQKTLHKKHEN